jgi:hypothetical protein
MKGNKYFALTKIQSRVPARVSPVCYHRNNASYEMVLFAVHTKDIETTWFV